MAGKKKTNLTRKAPTVEEIVSQIVELEEPSYAAYGENDENGYQVFTPEFIVDGMIQSIGEKEIEDWNKTILEPTSGDGAFTGRTLERRLKKAAKDKDTFPANALRSLATLYSIEMDRELMERQRNNIFTIFMKAARKMKFESNDKLIENAKAIIANNFLWAMTNMDSPITMMSPDVAYRMPEASEGELFGVEFPVWTIGDDLTCTMHREPVEVEI